MRGLGCDDGWQAKRCDANDDKVAPSAHEHLRSLVAAARGCSPAGHATLADLRYAPAHPEADAFHRARDKSVKPTGSPGRLVISDVLECQGCYQRHSPLPRLPLCETRRGRLLAKRSLDRAPR